jgi:hypothetical protein
MKQIQTCIKYYLYTREERPADSGDTN